MAFAARKWLVNLRNTNKYSKICYINRSTNATLSSWKYAKSGCSIKSELKARCLHTTGISNKIVAFKLSDIGEGIRDVVIKEWFVQVGDKVQQFDNICEVQSDKASVTITSRYDGVITKLYHGIDETALVGQPLVDIEVDGLEDATPSSTIIEAVKDGPKLEGKSTQRVKVLTTPAVRRIAAQFQVDLSSVNATGRNGRVLKEDVLSHLNMTADKSNDVPENVISVEAVPLTAAFAKAEIVLEDRVVPVTGFMKAMVKSMTEAMKIPHFVLSDEYNVTKLVELRQSLKEVAKKRGIKLTYMPIIIKAASQSLLSYPVLNSSLDGTCENIIYKANHNIGVAMDTPYGLVVPIIRAIANDTGIQAGTMASVGCRGLLGNYNAHSSSRQYTSNESEDIILFGCNILSNVQTKSIFEIATELNSLQEKGIKGQLGLNDLIGGTFTISNIGIIGGTYTKPVILPPQVSIGAFGKIQVLPRFDTEGNVIKAHILSVSWSADHRLIDGVTMARFSNQLKEYLEDPQKLILDL